MKFKKFDLIILTIFFVAAATLAYGASYVVHDFGSGIMHEAKDVYRTNTRSVENDIASNEVRIASLQTKADSTENALEADKANLSANYDTTATVNGKLALKANSADVYSKIAADLLLANKADISTMTAALSLKANAADVYTTAAVDLLLNAKLDVATISNYYLKTETFSTAEIIALLAPKANAADVFTTGEITLLLADKADTASVTTVSGNLASHTSEVSGAHQGSAIAIDSSGFVGNLSLADNTTQKAFAKLDALSGLPATNAITKIYGDADVDGCETGAVWLIGTNGVSVNRTSNTFEINIDSATKWASYYTAAATDLLLADKADTGAVALKANSADVYTKSQTESTIETILAGKGYATTAQTSEEVAVHNESTAAHSTLFANYAPRYWYLANMANGDYTGEIVVSTMSASQTQYNVVYMKSDGWEAAKADAATTLPALGVALETGTGAKKVLVRGLVKNTSWSFTVGAKIYVSAATAGAITATAPSTATNQIQVVGVAVAADTVYFFFDSTYVEI